MGLELKLSEFSSDICSSGGNKLMELSKYSTLTKVLMTYACLEVLYLNSPPVRGINGFVES